MIEDDTEIDLLAQGDGWKLYYGRSNDQDHVVDLGCFDDEGELTICC